MSRALVAAFVLLGLACRSDAGAAFLEAQRALMRPGVDLRAEEREVRRVLAQRHLTVMDELRGPGFVALGASTLDGRLSAVRVITTRGVVFAEDGAAEDLFEPSRVELVSDFGPTLGDHVLVALLRTRTKADAGCVTVQRLLPDASLVPVVLDVSSFGSRACVASIAQGARGHLDVTIAWPGLATLRTPVLASELSFVPTPIGRPEPRTLVARVVADGDWLDRERAHLESALPANAEFSERHAIGVARAALALQTGKGRDEQLAAYRTSIGRVLPGSYEAEVVSDTEAHLGRGWLDAEAVPEQAGADTTSSAPSDAEVIGPSDLDVIVPSEAEVIEPQPAEPAEDVLESEPDEASPDVEPAGP